MSAVVTYAPDRIGYRYHVPDAAYAKGYHRGQDVRQIGPDGGSIITEVDAIDAGKVVYVGRPNALLQLTVVIDTGRANGRYESHSHMADVIVTVGQWVESGQRLGRNAGMDEKPGMVDGVHDHITITDAFNGAWMTWMDEYDPLPFINAAYQRAITGQSASGTARPFEEDDMSKEAEDAIFAVKAALLDGRPQSGMAVGALDLILGNTTDTIGRILPQGQPWDQLQLLVSLTTQILHAATPADVDVPKLLSDLEQRLKASFQQQFESFGVAIRAEILASLGNMTIDGGASKDDVEKATAAAIDSALSRIGVRLTLTPTSPIAQ